LRSRSLIAGALLLGAPAALSACGSGSVATITVGAAVPVAATAPLPVATVDVGPGAVRQTLRRNGYAVAIRVVPNRADTPNRVVVAVSRYGEPVSGAQVTLTASMLTMDMGVAHYRLTGDGSYSVRTPAWLMPGLWDLAVSVRPPGGTAVSVALADRLRA
jgi:YtkA-like protein